MILRVHGLEFSYNSHPVLRDICFEMHRGSVLGVLGVNGAGKSTLVKCINRILKPKKGTVLVEEQDIQSMKGPEIARRMGYVPQRPADDQLTVFDTVLLGRRPHIEWSPGRRDLEVVERIIKLMRLEHLALRPVSRVSGGEAQKVVLARALAQEPDLLLLDEPTSNLDLRNQLEVMNLVRHAVISENLSAVVSVHDINLALRFADRFLLLKDTSIHAICDRSGLTADVIRQVYDVDVILGQLNGYPVVIPH
jgi:iron complex transport system ATP-binding protein